MCRMMHLMLTGRIKHTTEAKEVRMRCLGEGNVIMKDSCLYQLAIYNFKIKPNGPIKT